jgi:hypothetical protein
MAAEGVDAIAVTDDAMFLTKNHAITILRHGTGSRRLDLGNSRKPAA